MIVTQSCGLKIFLPNGPWLARPPPARLGGGGTEPAGVCGRAEQGGL